MPDEAISETIVQNQSSGLMPVSFLIDVAGMDESRKDLASSLAQGSLLNPGRDSTTLTIVSIDLSTLADLHHPTYQVIHRQSWTGANPLAVFGALKNLVASWKPAHIVIDSTGVGEGLYALLDRAFPTRVIPIKITTQEKSELGYRFLSIIETGRFSDPNPTDLVRLQYDRCLYEILPGPGKVLRWGVPEGERGPDGSLVHDDFLLADSLVAALDDLPWFPSFHSVFISPTYDPLKDLSHF